MACHSSSPSESDRNSIKSLLKQLAKDFQSLSHRQLQHEVQIIEDKKERDAHLAILEEELKIVKEKDDSHAEGSMRINDYYQPPARRTRREHPKETRVDLPHFYGKENFETYLDWEMKVEQLFACYHVSEERKVPRATLSFQGNAMYWWNALKRESNLHKDPPLHIGTTLREP